MLVLLPAIVGILRSLVRGVAVYNIVRCGQTGFAFCALGSSLGWWPGLERVARPCWPLAVKSPAYAERLLFLAVLPGGGRLLALHAWWYWSDGDAVLP